MRASGTFPSVISSRLPFSGKVCGLELADAVRKALSPVRPIFYTAKLQAIVRRGLASLAGA